MTNKVIMLNKLFPCPPHNNYNKLMIDIDSISHITTPNVTDIIISIIKSHIVYDKKGLTVFDGTACVGGDTIAFGNHFDMVIATEIKKNKYDMLVNNLKEFELYNVVPINDDCLNVYSKINCIDIMYFDPPWGGRDYKYKKNIRLKLGNEHIENVINNILNEHIRSNVKLVVFKLPKNYDLYHLYHKTKNNNVIIYLYELDKMNIVIYKKI